MFVFGFSFVFGFGFGWREEERRGRRAETWGFIGEGDFVLFLCLHWGRGREWRGIGLGSGSEMPRGEGVGVKEGVRIVVKRTTDLSTAARGRESPKYVCFA